MIVTASKTLYVSRYTTLILTHARADSTLRSSTPSGSMEPCHTHRLSHLASLLHFVPLQAYLTFYHFLFALPSGLHAFLQPWRQLSFSFQLTYLSVLTYVIGWGWRT
ncbi:hypothetical protein NA56DRAFT_341615 [Hyaloscypha hepaticicola]|uniref:Uncharacterized protein n=1 Tax=Hyaloscypha hepaticicola TaxID=2082293 RepID=A0A2J6QJ38_9HELO|nr:hypothetical protein NA56DRAFT_341615 [Hyaloscypha hepaticicola]